MRGVSVPPQDCMVCVCVACRVYFQLKSCPDDERRFQERPETVLERDIARGDGAGGDQEITGQVDQVARRHGISLF